MSEANRHSNPKRAPEPIAGPVDLSSAGVAAAVATHPDAAVYELANQWRRTRADWLERDKELHERAIIDLRSAREMNLLRRRSNAAFVRYHNANKALIHLRPKTPDGALEFLSIAHAVYDHALRGPTGRSWKSISLLLATAIRRAMEVGV